jgi:hypothetical protein
MSARDRLLATVAIWTAFMVTAIVLLDRATGQSFRPMSEWSLITITALIAGAACAGTYAVWHSALREEGREKQKRTQSRRVARLVETLDEDEIHDLEALLAARENLPVHHRQS